MNCVFCQIQPIDIVEQTESLLAIYDRYPVTKGHLLIIPKAHRENFFSLEEQEQNELFWFLHRLTQYLQRDDPTIAGFNIGANCGAAAGQTIFHCHIHLIPRRAHDTEDPRGGVRGVIPGRQGY